MEMKQALIAKRKLIRQGLNHVENKEEEFFKMNLLSFQLLNKTNMKVMKLDAKQLFKRAQEEQLPFFKWNEWLKQMVEKMQFEHIYKKKTEYEYSKMLSN